MSPESKTFDYQKFFIRRFLLTLIVSLLLASCGGGDGGSSNNNGNNNGGTTTPNLSNGAPAGILSTGTISAVLTITTDADAVCKYATTSGVDYSAMVNTFSTSGGLTHATDISGFSDGQTYNYYVRCQDTSGNTNTNDYLIAFAVAGGGDTTAPVTLASPPGGTYNSYNKTLAVTLTCSDDTDSGCAAMYYSITYGSITPVSWTPYTGPINASTTTNNVTLNFYSVDTAGNTEPFKSETYLLSPETVTLSRVSVSSDGWQTDHNSYRPFISADGLKYVAFYSYASNLVAGDIKWNADIFLRDVQNGTTLRVSKGYDGSQADSDSWSPAISDNLRYVAFRSAATNLVAKDTNGTVDVFVYDMQTDTTERVNLATGGAQSSGDTTPFDNPDGNTMDGWYSPAMSADGRYVAFSSNAPDLVPNDNNGVWDVFVHDRQTGITERVSVNANGVGTSRDSEGAAISADGRYVAFRTGGQLDIDRSTGWGSYPVTYPLNIYLRDRQNSTTTLVSISTGGTLSNNNNYPPSITADGRYVIFPSAAKTLAGWDTAANDWVDTNGLDDVFVRDMQTGTTERVSVATGGVQGNGPSYWGAISDDGRYVSFSSSAINLTANDTNGVRDVFVRDRWTDTTRHVVMAYDDANPNARALAPSISSDGQYIVFDSLAGNLIRGDTNNSWDIFRVLNPLYVLPE